MSYLYKYPFLINHKTPYAKKMMALSNRIFGELVQETESRIGRRSARTMRMFSIEPLYKQKSWVHHYPRLPELAHLMKNLRSYGLYRDEHEDFKENFARLRILRGKIPRPYGSSEKSSRVMFDTKK